MKAPRRSLKHSCHLMPNEAKRLLDWKSCLTGSFKLKRQTKTVFLSGRIRNNFCRPFTTMSNEHWPLFPAISVQLHTTVVFPRLNFVPDWWLHPSWTFIWELSEHEVEFHITRAFVLPLRFAFAIWLAGQFAVGLVTSVINGMKKFNVTVRENKMSWPLWLTRFIVLDIYSRNQIQRVSDLLSNKIRNKCISKKRNSHCPAIKR